MAAPAGARRWPAPCRRGGRHRPPADAGRSAPPLLLRPRRRRPTPASRRSARCRRRRQRMATSPPVIGADARRPGAVGGGAHADDEHVIVLSVPGRIALLTAILEAVRFAGRRRPPAFMRCSGRAVPGRSYRCCAVQRASMSCSRSGAFGPHERALAPLASHAAPLAGCRCRRRAPSGCRLQRRRRRSRRAWRRVARCRGCASSAGRCGRAGRTAPSSTRSIDSLLGLVA